MQFSRIMLTDFRQYYGKQELTFARGQKNNVTLINGPNGAGKTCLFTAMNWCLYAEGAENIGALVSKEAALNIDFGETAECEVRIWFEHQGEKYLAIRRAKERKEKLDEPPEGEEEKYKNFKLLRLPEQEGDFILLRGVDGNMKSIDDARRLINSILPRNARQYFLFDGEKIDQLTRPDHDAEIEQAIRNILQLPSIENAKQHLAIVLKEQTRESKKDASKDEEELYDQISEQENEIERIDSDIEDQKKNLKATKELLKKVDEDLRKAESVKDLIERRGELEKQEQDDRQDREIKKKKLRNNLSLSYIIPAKPIIEKAMAHLQEKKNRGEIPPVIQEPFIKELLERCKCMCGNELSEGSEGRKKVLKYLEDCKEYNAVAQTLADLLGNLGTIETKTESVAENIVESMQEIGRLDQSIESVQRRLEDLHQELKGRDADISQLERQRKSLEQESDTIIGQIGSLKNSKGICKETIDKLMAQIEKLGKEKRAAKKYVAMRKLCQQSLDVLNEVFERFASEKRKEIEGYIKRIFEILIWKTSQFPKIRLTDNYQLQVFDQWGSPAREELSAGERQVLSLSFIAAMATVSGGDVPLVMDTPFGRISSKVRQNIVTEIPNITQQLILMVQDRELTGKEKEMLKERVGREYDLMFKQGCTRIEEV